VGQNVTLYGWLRKPRVLASQGVAFLPVYDTSGVTQFVYDVNKCAAVLDSHKSAEKVVKAVGVVKPRPPEAVNADTPTGEIEVELQSLDVLNEASKHPFSTFGHVKPSVSVEQQLRERPHYLRLPHMQNNLRLRSKVAMSLRESLVDSHGFVEIETPTLFKKTPEGAQEFIVPTRTRGKYFSLVQSPQQFKQLLMVSGFDRYFQFARCYRDEDQRSDRQPEFTQVDLEMSFVDSNCVMGLTEEILHSTITSLCPHFSVPNPPFPRMEYRRAMELYGSDKPDTRYEMKLQNLDSVWQEQLQEVGVANEVAESHLCPRFYGVNFPQLVSAMEDLDDSRAKEVTEKIKSLTDSHLWPTAVLTNYSEVPLDPLVSTLLPAKLLSDLSKQAPLTEMFAQKLRDRLGWQEGDVCVISASSHVEIDKHRLLSALGGWRSVAAGVLCETNRLDLDSTQLNFLWVMDFPLFSPSSGKGGSEMKSVHHPFTAPVPEDRELLLSGPASVEQLTQVKGQHYDLVVNGVELGGGSIRIHCPTLQEHVLTDILKVSGPLYRYLG
jgi:aspartyl-tRNA synthetase